MTKSNEEVAKPDPYYGAAVHNIRRVVTFEGVRLTVIPTDETTEPTIVVVPQSLLPDSDSDRENGGLR
jgi:hypothetical protein